MKELSQIIDFHDGMIEELKRTVFHEDELEGHATSMTSKQYDSLVKNSKRGPEEKRPSVIPHWLGLPVQPTDPYQDGKIFSQCSQIKLSWLVFTNVQRS